MSNRTGTIRLLFSRILLLLGLILGLTGCQYRNLAADTNSECLPNKGKDHFTNKRFDPGSAARPSKAPILKVIEFTGNGEFVDRCQWSDLLYELRGSPARQAPSDRSKFMVLYVHGWKHDASEMDLDLQEFSALIAKLTTSVAASDPVSDVIGVYVAWPGLSTKVPVLNNLSFWSRKGAADRVSAAANFSKIISSIASVRVQRHNRNDFIVGIGHSFGARILFSSVAPLLMHELQMKHPGLIRPSYQNIDGVIDLTILINPAFEATRFTAFHATRRWQEEFGKDQEPILLAVSTANDQATKVAFPIGQVLGSRWDERERTTLGNYTEYITHRLDRSPRSALNAGNKLPWYNDFCIEKLCLYKKPKPGDQERNPFIVATTTGDVLNGHSDIWKDSFQTWLWGFIEVVRKRKAIGVVDSAPLAAH
ncbi:hypothetical protein CR155_20245 [Pollutimonas nitritireducens]|uniref:Uncharacterized protein n=1 Tax=Pollutimonas nitritireducens TaxID=2045209 RepID=A0A2N4UAI6_9BURK|nr:hypothetical protein [Pollutimonas nitritireducens]PLC52030.1 hypothetical protein CR155_20245 [Pollutimonas nitritireducens]